MHKKCITLAVLMLPTFGYGKSNESRINKLRKTQYHKRLEVCEIAKRISEADDFINSCRVKYELFLELAVQKKLDGSKSEEEMKQYIINLNEALLCDVKAALRGEKELTAPLVTELFDQTNPELVDAFDSLKFLYIRGATERDLLESLVASYQERIKELSVINKELSTLEN